MTLDTLEVRYVSWLMDQLDPTGEFVRLPYTKLICFLHAIEFIWIIPNDGNRYEDGLDLRNEFLEIETVGVPPEEADWLDVGCTMFELMVVLARNLNYQTEKPIHECFIELLENVGLAEYTQMHHNLTPAVVGEQLSDVIWRTYEADGTGGFFPLKNPSEDQRKVELHYQMHAYISENELV